MNHIEAIKFVVLVEIVCVFLITIIILKIIFEKEINLNSEFD